MTDLSEVENEISELRAYLSYNSHLYYVKDNPEITDADYDRAFLKLKTLEDKYPQFFDKNSPTQRIGGERVSSLESTSLDVPMLSLDDVFSVDDAIVAIKKIYNAAGLVFNETSLDLICETKLDGLAIETTFENGDFSVAKTRGNGSVGEIVTHTVRTIQSIPLKLKNSENIRKIQVRGEAFMPKSSLDEYNNYAIKNNLKPLANYRNGAAGTIRQFDSKIAALRKLDFIPYSIAKFDGDTSDLPSTQFDLLQFFGRLGFKVNPYIKKIKSVDELFEFHKMIMSVRDSLPYEIDGIVIKLNSLESQRRAGYTGRAARFAIALKLPATEESSEILSVSIETGRTGVITPTAKIFPVKIGGVTVSSATLHNFDLIKSKGIAIGDKVSVYRAGDVVPSISGKLTNGVNRIEIEEPKFCPCCGAPTLREDAGEKSGSMLFCTGGVACGAQALNSLIYFASKPCMDFYGVGSKLIEELFKNNFLRKFSDFYQLKPEQLKKLPRMGEKSANKAISGIQSIQNIELARFIAAIGIHGIGEDRAKCLANHFKELDLIINASLKELLLVKNIGYSNATSVKKWFENQENLQEINKIKEYGILILPVINNEDTSLNNQIWVLTGSLQTMDRKQAKDYLSSKGAKIAGSVSSKTNVVVYGENAGSKLSMAESLNANGANIKLLSEVEFMKLFSL